MKKIASIFLLLITISFFNDSSYSQDGGEQGCPECPSLITPGPGGDECALVCYPDRRCIGWFMMTMPCPGFTWHRWAQCEMSGECNDVCDLDDEYDNC
jgi:hypothetical protein